MLFGAVAKRRSCSHSASPQGRLHFLRYENCTRSVTIYRRHIFARPFSTFRGSSARSGRSQKAQTRIACMALLSTCLFHSCISDTSSRSTTYCAQPLLLLLLLPQPASAVSEPRSRVRPAGLTQCTDSERLYCLLLIGATLPAPSCRLLSRHAQ